MLEPAIVLAVCLGTAFCYLVSLFHYAHKLYKRCRRQDEAQMLPKTSVDLPSTTMFETDSLLPKHFIDVESPDTSTSKIVLCTA